MTGPRATTVNIELSIQAYDFKVVYKPGISNMSDYLSRHQVTTTEKPSQSRIVEEYVLCIADQDVPKAMTMQEIVQETSKDSDLQTVISNVRHNTWNKTYMYPSNKYIDTFSRVKNQLTVTTLEKGVILLHETKLVIPRSLQRKVIQIAHEGHQGIVRNKQLLQEKVYFPNIDKLVEETCQSCIPCLAATEKNVPEPLKMSKMPENAFDEVSLDF